MKKILVFIGLSLWIILINSCEKEANLQEYINLESKFDTDDIRLKIGEIIIKSFSDEQFKDHLIEQIKFQNNVDNEVIFSELVSSKFSSGESLLNYFQRPNGSLRYRSDIIDEALKNDPNLSLFIFNPENETDEITEELLDNINQIAIITEDINEESLIIYGYDKLNNKIQFSGQEAPNKPTAVISNNVDLIPINPKTFISHKGNYYPHAAKLKPKIKSKYYYYYFTSDVLNSRDIVIEFRTINSTCPRDASSAYDKLYTVKWNTCSNYNARCGWWEGSCRLRTNVLFGTKSSNTYGFGEVMKDLGDRTHSTYTTWNPITRCSSTKTVNVTSITGGVPVEVFNWNQALIGSPVKYVWYEVDEADITGSLSLTPWNATYKDNNNTFVSTVQATVSFSPKNDQLGESFVEYCDQVLIQSPYTSPKLYNTGSITFSVYN